MTLHNIQPYHDQRGAALITGLIFLVILTLISVAAVKTTSLEERMAGNARDRDMAFQAAEAAVRRGLSVLPTLSPSNFPASGCTNGLCAVGTSPVWTTITNASNWSNASVTRLYTTTVPSVPAATPIAGVSTQPSYIIELIPSPVAQSGESARTGTGSAVAGGVVPYRVTARGWGFTTQAQATTQASINF